MPITEDLSFVPETRTPSKPARALRTATLRGRAAVAGVFGDWAVLRGAAIDPPASCRLLAQRAGACPPDAPRVITVRQDGRLVGLWALRRHSLGPIRVARRLGGELQTYDGLVVHRDADPEAVAAAAWAEVSAWRDVDAVQLDALRARDALATVPALAARARPVSITRTVDLRPWSSGDAFVASLPKRKRGSLRRRTRKLAEQGEVVFTSELDPVARVRAVQDAIRLKLSWLDAQAEAAPVFRSAAFQEALLACAADPRVRDDLAVLTLRVGGRVAAVEVCTIAGATCGSFLGAYDPAFAKEGAGTALTLRTIDWAIRRGLQTYDLLPPDTAFKREWADRDAAVCAVTVPLTATGRALLPAMRDGRAWLKARYHELPEERRRRMRDLLALVVG